MVWFSDAQWRPIAPHLPTNLRGPARDDDRRIISGVVHMLKGVLGFTKVRYRGLYKNAHRMFVTCALANIFMARHHLM